MAISDEEVLRIARLAHIELGADEVAEYRRDLNTILGHIDKLKGVAAPEERMTHAAEVESTLRADQSEAPLAVEDVLANSAQVVDGQFRVPKVVEGA